MFQVDDAALAKVRTIIDRHTGGIKVKDDTPLISGGILDSLAVVDLIVDLEKTFGVKIPITDVQPDDFDSVRLIAETIARVHTKRQ